LKKNLRDLLLAINSKLGHRAPFMR